VARICGVAVIEQTRLTDPVNYVRIVASLLPKQTEKLPNPLEGLTDDELDKLLFWPSSHAPGIRRKRHGPDDGREQWRQGLEIHLVTISASRAFAHEFPHQPSLCDDVADAGKDEHAKNNFHNRLTSGLTPVSWHLRLGVLPVR